VLLRGKTAGFDSWAVADPRATVWARAPYDSVVVGGNYKYREWFNGQHELRRDADVEATPRSTTGFTRAFASTASGAPLLIGLAAPILSDSIAGQQPHVLGVLNAGIHLGTFNAWLGLAESQTGGICPDRFVLLMHRGQLLRHPCSATEAAPLPVAGYLNQAAVQSLLRAPGGMSANFQDPMRAVTGSTNSPALAVAKSLDVLPDWTLILQQDVDAALRPITALTDDFHKPAHLALGFGFGALILLVVLLWRGGFWRALLPSSDVST
jgi:hypothetical protein